MKKILLCGLLACLSTYVFAKPVIWVNSDMSDPTHTREGNHPTDDPDDICALAALMLQANRFDIRGVVIASNPRKNLQDPMPFVNDVLLAAYKADLPGLNKKFGDFPSAIPFLHSSMNRNQNPVRFRPDSDYSDISEFETVQKFIAVAKSGPVYLLNWGPITESAISIKHLITTGQTQALKNITLISHWTMSRIAQGSLERPYNVANCNSDKAACDYLHALAAEKKITFYELGSVGQGGLVNGSEKFKRYSDFNKSRLGQIFVNSKFYDGKPDQSDASTFWILTKMGISLDDYIPEGDVSAELEAKNVQKFKSVSESMIEDLAMRSASAASKSAPFPNKLMAHYFTYLYNKNNTIEAHCPYDCEISFYDKAGLLIEKRKEKKGSYKLIDMRNETPIAKVEVLCEGNTKVLKI